LAFKWIAASSSNTTMIVWEMLENLEIFAQVFALFNSTNNSTNATQSE
jgi:hypothetical protein